MWKKESPTQQNCIKLSWPRFLDPRHYDVNHVVGARGLSDPALLYHFAGRGKDWDAMLQTFGLDRGLASELR